MPVRMKLFTFAVGVTLFIFIIELVRRRKIREEYSLLWLLSGVIICLVSLWYEAIAWITKIVGAVYAPSILFFFGLIFLAMISIFYSVKLSSLSNQMKNLSQKMAILEAEKNKDD
jgi:hypothetical protein